MLVLVGLPHKPGSSCVMLWVWGYWMKGRKQCKSQTFSTTHSQSRMSPRKTSPKPWKAQNMPQHTPKPQDSVYLNKYFSTLFNGSRYKRQSTDTTVKPFLKLHLSIGDSLLRNTRFSPSFSMLIEKHRAYTCHSFSFLAKKGRLLCGTWWILGMYKEISQHLTWWKGEKRNSDLPWKHHWGRWRTLKICKG